MALLDKALGTGHSPCGIGKELFLLLGRHQTEEVARLAIVVVIILALIIIVGITV